MNAVSSRSHTIFMLYITGEHEASGSRLTGCLNLVDLAGSERVGEVRRGGRQAEGSVRHQQEPLVPRRRVPGAVQRPEAHPRTATASSRTSSSRASGATARRSCSSTSTPEAPSAEESMCSLKFAAQVNAVELGRGGAKRNIVSGIGKKEDKEDSSSGDKKPDDKKKVGKRPATARTAAGAAKKSKR